MIRLLNIPEDEIKEALDDLPQDIKHKMMSTYGMIIQKGKKEGLEEVVLRGHKKGLPNDTLSAITGLSPKEVEAIIAKHSRKQK